MKNRYLIEAYNENDWLYNLNDGTEEVHQFTMPEGPRMKNECSDTIYKKGDHVNYHIHKKGCETFYIAKGSVEVTVRGRRCVITEGDILHLPPNTAHGFTYLEDGTVWRELFHDIDMAGSTINKNRIKDNYPGMYEETEFRAWYLDKVGNFPREEPVHVKDTKKEDVWEVRTHDFGFSTFVFDKVVLKQKVGRWETDNVHEVWMATMKQGAYIEWGRPYDESNLFFIAKGKVRFNVLGEEFTASGDNIVYIPEFTKFSICAEEDGTEVFDYGCTARLLDLLEDYDALISGDSRYFEDVKAKETFLRKYDCYITKTNLIYSHCE